MLDTVDLTKEPSCGMLQTIFAFLMSLDFDVSELDFSKSSDGLIPAIAQDHRSGKILMAAFVNRAAVEATVKSGFAHFFSRSRQRLWQKGEESGNTLQIVGIATDCDHDAVVYSVIPVGPTCHTGAESCFFHGDEVAPLSEILFSLDHLIAERQQTLPPDSYVADLFRSGIDRIAQKVGEEGVETVIAAKNPDRDAFVGESADLLFHLLVLLRSKDCSLDDVLARLKERSK